MIYFDNAATTRPSKAAIAALNDALLNNFGNPSSSHFMGDKARTLLEGARQEVAEALGARADEIYFTSGGTEANNLALQGVCEASPQRRQIIISAVEHPAVYKTCRFLKKKGYQIYKVPVALDGSIDEDYLAHTLSDNTALVSMMLVNNETGAIFPLKKVVDIVKSYREDIPVHTDAVQALGKIPIDVRNLGVDLLTVSSHKIQGPKGAGALFVKEGTKIFPLVFGGDQERGLRPGTEAIPTICAFGKAAYEAKTNLPLFIKQTEALKSHLMQSLEGFSGAVLNSEIQGVSHIVNFSLPEKNPDDVLAYMSEQGICISRGAACKSNHKHGPSMLMSFGLDAQRADSALRISFSHENTEAEVVRFIEVLAGYLND